MKEYICTGIGVAGAAISSLFGGFDMGLKILVVFMIIDYITGFIVAAVFNNSPKTAGGALESRAGLKGLFRKGGMLLIVLIATQLEMLSGIEFLRDTVVIAFIANETISVIENAGLMGIPIPDVIIRAIEILKSKEDK